MDELQSRPVDLVARRKKFRHCPRRKLNRVPWHGYKFFGAFNGTRDVSSYRCYSSHCWVILFMWQRVVKFWSYARCHGLRRSAWQWDSNRRRVRAALSLADRPVLGYTNKSHCAGQFTQHTRTIQSFDARRFCSSVYLNVAQQKCMKVGFIIMPLTSNFLLVTFTSLRVTAALKI